MRRIRLSARRSDRFIAFPHVILRLCSPEASLWMSCQAQRRDFDEIVASIWSRAKACLVLLLPMVSGSATMNDSLCVSTLTTTRRPPRRLRSSTRSRARPAIISAMHRACITSDSRQKRSLDDARSAISRRSCTPIRLKSCSRAAAPRPTTSRSAGAAEAHRGRPGGGT